MICSKHDIGKDFAIALGSIGASLAAIAIIVVTAGLATPEVVATVGPLTAAVEESLGFPVEEYGIVQETKDVLGPWGWIP